MPLSNKIVLRPRFKKHISNSKSTVLMAFENVSKNTLLYKINCVDDHVFIRIPKHKQNFWSPQLHLEILEGDKNDCEIFGVFGPNPSVWTFFMFLHFIVVVFFLGTIIWIYSNYSLDKDFTMQIAMLFFLLIIWLALYLFGKMGKTAAQKEMHDLYDFMEHVLNKNY